MRVMEQFLMVKSLLISLISCLVMAVHPFSLVISSIHQILTAGNEEISCEKKGKTGEMPENCVEKTNVLMNAGEFCDGLELMSESISFYNRMVRKK